MAKNEEEFEYNWQESKDEFLKWFLPAVTAGILSDELLAELSELTDKFTKVKVGVTINGIPVKADAFLDGVHHSMVFYTEAAARKLIRENTSLDKLSDLVESAIKDMQEGLFKQAREAGLDIHQRDEWD